MKRSKSYAAVAEKVDPGLYAPSDAMAFAKANSRTKFDETVDVAVRLGVDPRKADQMVRGTVNLPNGTGKTARSSSLLPVIVPKPQRLPAPTRWVPTSSSTRCRRATWTLTPSSQPRT